jgi:hypothetical protein
MLFVTNYTGYQLLARPDKTKLMPHPNGPDWGTINVVVQEPIMLEFKPKGILTYAQRRRRRSSSIPPRSMVTAPVRTGRLVSRVTRISRGRRSRRAITGSSTRRSTRRRTAPIVATSRRRRCRNSRSGSS